MMQLMAMMQGNDDVRRDQGGWKEVEST